MSLSPRGYLIAHDSTDESRAYLQKHGDQQAIDFSLVRDSVNLLDETDVERLLDAPAEDYWAATGASGYGSEISGASIVPK